MVSHALASLYLRVDSVLPLSLSLLRCPRSFLNSWLKGAIFTLMTFAQYIMLGILIRSGQQRQTPFSECDPRQIAPWICRRRRLLRPWCPTRYIFSVGGFSPNKPVPAKREAGPKCWLPDSQFGSLSGRSSAYIPAYVHLHHRANLLLLHVLGRDYSCSFQNALKMTKPTTLFRTPRKKIQV
jgi:hypothetical protein